MRIKELSDLLAGFGAPMSDNGFLKLKEAAPILGVSRSRLYEMTARREVAFYRIGAKLLFRLEDLHAYLASKRVEAEEAPSPPPSPVFTHRRQLS